MKNYILAILFLISATVVAAQQPASHRTDANCTGLFCHAEGTVFNLEDETNNSAIGYFNILDWLQGRVAGLQVYQIRNERIAFIRNRPATVYVDEMRTDMSFLNMLPVTDIAAVKIIKQPFGLASAGGGVIAIYTKKGGEEEESA